MKEKHQQQPARQSHGGNSEQACQAFGLGLGEESQRKERATERAEPAMREGQLQIN